MRNFLIAAFLTISVIVGGTLDARAQGWDQYEGGAKIQLGEKQDKFIRLITWAQVWARAIETNPGTVVSGSDTSWQTDLSLRRARFLVFGKPRKNLLFLVHIGVDNLAFRSREAAAATPRSTNPFAFVHDAWLEQSFFDGKLALGGGLHYWWGISRMTNASTLNFMTIDSPMFT